MNRLPKLALNVVKDNELWRRWNKLASLNLQRVFPPDASGAVEGNASSESQYRRKLQTNNPSNLALRV